MIENISTLFSLTFAFFCVFLAILGHFGSFPEPIYFCNVSVFIHIISLHYKCMKFVQRETFLPKIFNIWPKMACFFHFWPFLAIFGLFLSPRRFPNELCQRNSTTRMFNGSNSIILVNYWGKIFIFFHFFTLIYVFDPFWVISGPPQTTLVPKVFG